MLSVTTTRRSLFQALIIAPLAAIFAKAASKPSPQRRIFDARTPEAMKAIFDVFPKGLSLTVNGDKVDLATFVDLDEMEFEAYERSSSGWQKQMRSAQSIELHDKASGELVAAVLG